MTSSAAAHYETWSQSVAQMKETVPEITRGFGGMFQRLMADGALAARDKELIALGIGMALRCDRCIYSHVEKCIKLGATREQVLEVAGVVVTMQGGPGYVYVPKIIDALDALGA